MAQDCSVKECSVKTITRKRSLCSAFSDSVKFEGPLRKKAKTTNTDIINDTDIMNNRINKFICDYNQNKNPILRLNQVVDVLYVANENKMNKLIENCKEKLELKRNDDQEIDVNDWYKIIHSFQRYFNLNKYKFNEHLLPFLSYFIKNNQFNDINNVILNSQNLSELSIDFIYQILKYTVFDSEEMKIIIINKYFQLKEKSNYESIINFIKKYFLSLMNFNDNDDMIQLINNIIDKKKRGNQGYSRTSSAKKNKVIITQQTEQTEQKQHNLDGDKKISFLLSKHGFSNIVKQTTTGQGSIWRAKYKKRKVIIKVALQIYVKKHNKLYENILNEVEILKYLNKNQEKLNNKYVIKLYEIINEKEYFMIILEDGGKDLFDFTKICHEKIENKKMKISDWKNTVKLIGYRLIKIINWLHDENNIVHLDLSLENICISNLKWINIDNNLCKLDPNFKIKLIDFGASQQFNLNDNKNNKSINCNFVIGKPAFCSPQIWSLLSFNPYLSDCWSFGVILFVLFIGTHPWQQPDFKNNKLFNLIVNEKDIDKLLFIWNRQKYIDQKMKQLLDKIFVFEENDRISISQIINEQYFECVNE